MPKLFIDLLYTTCIYASGEAYEPVKQSSREFESGWARCSTGNSTYTEHESNNSQSPACRVACWPSPREAERF